MVNILLYRVPDEALITHFIPKSIFTHFESLYQSYISSSFIFKEPNEVVHFNMCWSDHAWVKCFLFVRDVPKLVSCGNYWFSFRWRLDMMNIPRYATQYPCVTICLYVVFNKKVWFGTKMITTMMALMERAPSSHQDVISNIILMNSHTERAFEFWTSRMRCWVVHCSPQFNW